MAKDLLTLLLLQHLKELRIPEPELEYQFDPMRRWRFDLAWVRQRLALEIEGGVWTGGRHVRPVGYVGDLEKYNRATVLGWRLLRVARSSVENGGAAKLVKEAWIS